jgi:hypothetical protein
MGSNLASEDNFVLCLDTIYREKVSKSFWINEAHQGDSGSTTIAMNSFALTDENPKSVLTAAIIETPGL